MSTVLYNCPCCGAPLAWKDGKLCCDSCGNAFEAEQLGSLNAGSESEICFEQQAGYYTRRDAMRMSAYTCENCGAELVTDATTTATQCPYCGSPTILPAQLSGGVKPQYVVPFEVTQEEATEAFHQYFKGKKLMPNVFLNSRNRIAEMKKLYVPYWLFDCAADADISYNAERVHTHRRGDWEITVTEHYLLRRAGSMAFSAIPVDGSQKMDDSISESLEPYDFDKAIPFEPAVLAGAMADMADVEAEECEKRAVERVEKSVEDSFFATTAGYTNVIARSKRIHSRDGVVTPVLMPVWLMTTEKQERGETKTYTFAINGQTGALTCDVVPDLGKSWVWFFGVLALVAALGYGGCAAFLGALALPGEWWVWIVLAALLVALITVFFMRAQLNTAEKKTSAAQYIEHNATNMTVREDVYLYRTEKRRRIEQQSDKEE